MLNMRTKGKCRHMAPTLCHRIITRFLITVDYFDPGCPPAAGAATFWIDTSSKSKISVAFAPISGGP
jgi:hypothetical protein